MHIYALVSILWIITITDSVISISLWMYPQQNTEYSENSNNENIFIHRNLHLEWNQWPANIPPPLVYEESNSPYSPDVNLRSFFIPNVPLEPISHPRPIHYIVPNDYVSSQGSIVNNAEPIYKSTTSRSIKPRPPSNIPRKMSTTSEVNGRRYDRKIRNSTSSSARPEVSTEPFVKKFDILNVKRKDSIFDFFKNHFHRETTSVGTIELKSSTPGILSKFVSSTPNPVSSSVLPPTIEPIDFRILNIEANNTKESLNEEPTTDTIITSNSTESYQIPVSSIFEKLENDTFKIDHQVIPLVQSNRPIDEVSLKNLTVDSTTEDSSFETISSVFQIPVENVTVNGISLGSDVIIDETTTHENIVTDVTTINLYNLNAPNFTTGISNEDQNQSTTDILPTSSSIIQISSPDMDIDYRKLTIDSNVSEIIEQEQFTTSEVITTTPKSAKNTDELIMETTSISNDNQSVVKNLPLSITISSNNETTDLVETIDHTESTSDVSDPVSYTDMIPSDSEVTVEDAIKFTCEYDPNETTTDNSFDRIEATSPQNSADSISTSTSNSSEIEIRIKRKILVSFGSESTPYSVATARFEIVPDTSMAKDSSNKFDIDRNDREEYIFNVTTSRSHVSKRL